MEVPWDAEHVVSAATRRQRQMAWVPAAGMSVIPQREGEGSVWEREKEWREQDTAREKKKLQISEEILEKMRTAF